METLRLWITGITIAAITGAIVLFLTPEGGAEKAVKTMVSLMLISSIIMPLSADVNSDTGLTLTDEEIDSENTEQINNTIANSLKNKLTESIEKILNENGIQIHSVSINMETNGDEISVKNVLVVIDEKSKNSVLSASEILEKELGVKADITLRGSGE